MTAEIVDGLALSRQIKEELKNEAVSNPHATLAVIMVGDNSVSAGYVERKVAFGQEIGVEVRVLEFDNTVTSGELVEVITRLNDDANINGLIVQLPLPEHIEAEKVLGAISAEKDVDALSAEPIVLSPVVAAVEFILNKYQVTAKGKQAAVVGNGRLVGRPLALYFAGIGADVKQYTAKDAVELPRVLPAADIIILGAGKPGLVRPEMVKEGVIIIDAATSEADGRLQGDAAPECAAKASLFTPVPGGVGPITMAMLFKNLSILASRQR